MENISGRLGLATAIFQTIDKVVWPGTLEYELRVAMSVLPLFRNPSVISPRHYQHVAKPTRAQEECYER